MERKFWWVLHNKQQWEYLPSLPSFQASPRLHVSGVHGSRQTQALSSGMFLLVATSLPSWVSWKPLSVCGAEGCEWREVPHTSPAGEQHVSEHGKLVKDN